MTVSTNLNDLGRQATVTIRATGIRRFRLRMWLGGKLLTLAARIMPVNLQIIDGTEPAPPLRTDGPRFRREDLAELIRQINDHQSNGPRLGV